MNIIKMNKNISLWLFSGAVLIYLMIIIGGITRLTGSGLSIVEWNLISGILPPFSEASWLTTFEKYKQFPQYLKENKAMTLVEFKQIFLWEYIHRLLGRIIGMFFFIPLVIFYVKRQLNPFLIKKLIFVLILIGIQGGLGWFMVKSGLVNVPQVSHYRLVLHFVTALFLLSFVFYLACNTTEIKQLAISRRLYIISKIITCFIFIQLMIGALMAGLKAGYAYNTFPDMNGEWMPTGILSIDPWWRNFFDNGITVQFIHRMLAFIIFLVITISMIYVRRSGIRKLSIYFYSLFAVLIVQILLGIFILLFHVPVALAVMHQAVGVILLLTSLYINLKIKEAF